MPIVFPIFICCSRLLFTAALTMTCTCEAHTRLPLIWNCVRDILLFYNIKREKHTRRKSEEKNGRLQKNEKSTATRAQAHIQLLFQSKFKQAVERTFNRHPRTACLLKTRATRTKQKRSKIERKKLNKYQDTKVTVTFKLRCSLSPPPLSLFTIHVCMCSTVYGVM